MVNPVEWLIDSGCSHHMSWNSGLFQGLTPLSFSPNFCAANGAMLRATHVGDIGSISNKVFIPNAFLVPELKCNLLSVGQLCNQGARVIFTSSACIIEDCSTGRVVGRGRKVYNHFVLDELNMFRHKGMGRRLQMPPAIPSETNPSSKWAQRNDASGSISQQLLTASNEANNRRLQRSTTVIKNFAIQALKVPQLETTLRWIESELMDDRVEISNDDSFLVDLEIYKHNLWILGYNKNSCTKLD